MRTPRRCRPRAVHSGHPGNSLPKYFSYPALEQFAEVLEVNRGHIGIAFVALLLLEVVHYLFELLADPLVILRLNARRLFHHDVRVHHYQPPIRVIHKPLIAAFRNQPRYCLCRQSDIQHRFHHSGHRLACAGADGHQQGVCGVAEFFAHNLFDSAHRLIDLFFEAFGVFFLILIKMSADLGSDCKARRDRHAEFGHFGKICSFAAEEVLHFRVSFALAAAEEIHHFVRHSHFLLLISSSHTRI